MTTITIDGRQYSVNPEHNLLQAILSLGLDLPYFCWHPALGSVGSCRQCAVTQYADAEDDTGKVTMACMTPVADDMHIGLADNQSADFRAGIIEALMTNHPHDCPVCEEGGECHLQDMTEMTGHTFRRFDGRKRTHRNQYLGPFLNHEMNRCIACYRCVRFYQDYAGGRDLSAQAAHNHVYFGREHDGVLQSPFSGNLAEVCPTGVFTDKTYSKRYARKWDLQTAPSVCAHCAVGCATLPAERYDRVVRVTNRYHPDLNGYFLCDRGRFGFDFNNAPERIEHSFQPAGDAGAELDEYALWADLLARLRDTSQAVFAVASPRASLEDNWALKSLVGEERYYAGVAGAEWRCLEWHRLLAAESGNRLATLAEVEQSDACLIVGEDVAGTAPRLALSLRQMVRNAGIDYAVDQGVPPWQDAAVRSLGQWRRSPLWQVVPTANALAEISESQYVAEPDTIGTLARAVAGLVEGDDGAAQTLDDEQRRWAQGCAQMLTRARRPALIGGDGLGRPEHLQALAMLVRALRRQGVEPRIYPVALEANSVGLAALARRGLDALIKDMEQHAEAGGECTLVVLENDLDQRLPPEDCERLRRCARHWWQWDYLVPSGPRADALLAVPSPFEKQGTFANASGMLQRFYPVRHNRACQPFWRQCREAVLATGNGQWPETAAWESPAHVREHLQSAVPAFTEIGLAGPEADYRDSGLKLARQTHRYSGRTAMHAHQNVAEGPPPGDEDSPYTFSMEGVRGDGPWQGYLWAPRWNSEQALNKFQEEVGGAWRLAMPIARLQFDTDREPSISAERAKETEDLRVLPRYDVFGAEPLARHAPAVAERAGPVVLGIDKATAERLSVADWDSVELHCGEQSQTCYVCVEEALCEGTVLIPHGRTPLPAPGLAAAAVTLKPAREPLPRPPRLIASDGGGGHG